MSDPTPKPVLACREKVLNSRNEFVRDKVQWRVKHNDKFQGLSFLVTIQSLNFLSFLIFLDSYYVCMFEPSRSCTYCSIMYDSRRSYHSAFSPRRSHHPAESPPGCFTTRLFHHSPVSPLGRLTTLQTHHFLVVYFDSESC